MNKILSLSVLLLTSLSADATLHPTTAFSQMRLSFNFSSREDINGALTTLEKIIPQVYREEVGDDIQKKAMVDDLIIYLKEVFEQSPIKSSTEQFDDIKSAVTTLVEDYQQGKISAQEEVLGLIQNGQRCEEVQFFTKLHAFLRSADGQILLDKVAACHENGIKHTATLLVFFNFLREVSKGLDKNNPATSLSL